MDGVGLSGSDGFAECDRKRYCRDQMAVSSQYSFLDADAELLALICPRPVQIQQGRADGIGWWPLQHEEFSLARKYYEKLDIAGRIEYADHQGGHEILVDEGISFLKKWL